MALLVGLSAPMTTYAHDPVASTIVATWPTGIGALARRVARVPSGCDGRLVRLIVRDLGRLSDLLWHAYTELETSRLDCDAVQRAVRHPNRVEHGMVPVAESVCEEQAHTLGRLLAGAGRRGLTDAMVREVTAECAAVLAADGGDLTGRAQQAVTLCRPGAPPAQVAAAHALLRTAPMGCDQLLTDVEPVAAATAATHWLVAAAECTAELIGHRPADVIALAEAIDHGDHRIARHVLRLLDEREPADVVVQLVAEAVLARRGHLVTRPIAADVAEGDADCPDHDPDMVTLALDPAEPGRSLLEGILLGIDGCFRVYLDELTGARSGPAPRHLDPDRIAGCGERFVAELRKAVRT